MIGFTAFERQEYKFIIDYFEEAIINFIEEDHQLLDDRNIERTISCKIAEHYSRIIKEKNDLRLNGYYVDSEYARNKANEISPKKVKTLKGWASNGDKNIQVDLVFHSRGNKGYDEQLKLNFDNLLFCEFKTDMLLIPSNWYTYIKQGDIEKSKEEINTLKPNSKKSNLRKQFQDCLRLILMTEQPIKFFESNKASEETVPEECYGYFYGIFMTGLTCKSSNKGYYPIQYVLFEDGKATCIRKLNAITHKFE